MDQIMSHDAWWICGMIWALFMGWAASSYASNFAYRLPRGETPFGRKPYCGDCNHALHPKDLFPIFSWLATGGKCRYCKAPVPGSYCLLELAYTLYIGLLYALFSFSDFFILFAFAGMVAQIIIMMAWDDDYASPYLISLALWMGIIYKLMLSASLQDAALSAFFGLFAGLALHSLLTRKAVSKDVYSLPKWIWLMAACGAWLSTQNLVLFVASFAIIAGILALACKQKPLASRIIIAQILALITAHIITVIVMGNGGLLSA